jgi:quinol monooxygenase YgiN
MFAVTVRFKVKPAHAEAFFARVVRQAQDSLDREPACRQFDVCRNPSDATDVLLYEIYVDSGAFAAHLKMPHFLAFDAETRELIDAKVVEKWSRA